MTIALGFLCPDGIVLCSDRQITTDGGMKYEKRKLWYMTGMFSGIRLSLISAFAGDPDLAKVMRTEIRERFAPELAKCKITGFQAPAARRVLEKLFKSKHPTNLEMLIGIHFLLSGEMCLFKTKAKRVVDAQTEYIGSGDSSVVRYLSKLVLPPNFKSISEAEVLGGYFVSVANRFTTWCSGGPDIATIRADGMISENAGGTAFRNQKENFLTAEEQVGKRLRTLLFSIGNQKVRKLNLSIVQKSAPEP